MPPDPRVQHLLRRAGFGATSAEATTFGQPGYAAVVPTAGMAGSFSPSTVINDARQRWLFRMVHTRRPLQEKMALFWHNHFATAYSKINETYGDRIATAMMAGK